MPFPTAHRQASLRNGAAIEFVQQEPLFVGVELAGVGGTYVMICVAGNAGAVWVDVDVVLFAGELIAEGLVKNCPIPKITTSASTTTTTTLLVLFTVKNYLYEFERSDDVLHQVIDLLLVERM